MLVLTRKPYESIMIGKLIEVKILEIGGQKVRIGVDAPHDVLVDRLEIYQRKQKLVEPEMNLYPFVGLRRW